MKRRSYNIEGYRINPNIDDGSVTIRRARKAHHCNGGHNGIQRTACSALIERLTIYVEYTGESSAYTSGQRYHLDCAKQQGLLIDALPPGLLTKAF